MSVIKICLQLKLNSPEALWEKIEEIYGYVPELIKKILNINGFDSYLALKGIRYEDKKEFFDSLEITIREIIDNGDPADKQMLEADLRGYGELSRFKLKPGHRNFIMNLMLEIDKSNVNEFFQNHKLENPARKFVKIQPPPVNPVKQIKYERPMFETALFQHTTSEQIKTPQTPVETMENCEQEPAMQEEYVFEEYLNDDKVEAIDDRVKEEFILQIQQQGPPSLKKKRIHAKPEVMYNEEFIASNNNPRKRRVCSGKFYPSTDEGVRDRFLDLIIQSMNCILSKEQLLAIENTDIIIQKESELKWIVLCPICMAPIKLSIKSENNGKYVNYKRSNFERHLRFKHCKIPEIALHSIPIPDCGEY